MSTGSVTVSLLLFADSWPFALPAHMTNEYVLPGTMSRVHVKLVLGGFTPTR